MGLLRHLADAVVDPVVAGLVVMSLGLVLVAVQRAKRTGWALTLIGAICLYLFSVPVFSGWLSRPLQRRALALAPEESVEGVRWVVVLGAGAEQEPGRPVTSWLSQASLERFVEGLRMAWRLEDSRLVFTGAGEGKHNAHSTAEVEAKAAAALGFPAGRIVELPEAHNTRQEIEAVSRLLGKDRFVLVTSVEHLPRAVREARERGLSPVPDPAGQVYEPPPGLAGWMPASDALAHSRATLHEIIGGLWYGLTEP